MTIAAITAVISMFCQFDVVKTETQFKWDCMDYMINCIVDKPSAKIKREDVLQCQEQFDKGARYKE